MKSNKKPTYQELVTRIDELQSEKELNQNEGKQGLLTTDYKSLFDNAPISIWNEDFTPVYEQLEELRKLDIPNIKVYLEENPEVLFSLLSKLKVTSVNKATLKLFKAESDQEFLNNIQHTFGEGADKVSADLIASIWKKEKSFTAEVNYKTIKGDEFAALLSVPIPQTALEQQTVPITIHSIQKLKEAELAKKESLLKLEQAQKIGRIGSWEWKWETDHAAWSDEMYRIYGVEKDDFEPTSENVSKTILEEDRDKMESAISRVIKGEAVNSFEFRIVRPNNEIRYLSIIALQISGGTIFGVTQDITNRKKIENELNEAQTLAKVGSWLFNPSNQKIEWSNEMFHIWDFDKRKGTPEYDQLVKRVHPDDLELWNSSVAKATNLGMPYDIEHRIFLPNGEQKVVRGICQPVLGVNGKVVSLAGTGQDITKQKLLDTELIRAKDKAEESENYLNKIINNIGDPVFVKDDQSRLIIVNDAFCEIFGLTRAQIIGKSLSEDVSPKEQECFLKIDKQVLLNGVESVNEESLTVRAGETRRISTRKTRFINSDGKVFLVGVIHDITERYRAEMELNEAQKLAHIGNWEYIIATDTVKWSKELFNIFERSPKLGAPNYSEQKPFYTKESFAVLDQAVNNCVEHEIPYELELDIYTSNGSIKHIISKGNFKKDNDNKVVSCYGSVQDITQRKVIQKELDIQNEKLNGLNKALNESQRLAKVGSWLFNPLTKKSEWSNEMFHIWGFDVMKPAPDYDTIISEVQSEDLELFRSAVDKAVNLGAPYDIEHRICLSNGEQKIVRAICQPILGVNGEVVSLVGTSQDITSQKQFEQVQVKNHRLKAMGEMSSSIAHDFNNSLQEMMGNLEIVKFEKELSANTVERLNVIGSIIGDVTERVSALQKFSDTEHIDKNVKMLDLNTLIEESLKESRPLWKDAMEKEGVRIDVINDFGKISKISCTSGELKAAIYNLVKNSVEAMPEGGDLIIKTGQKSGGVYATFTDTGMGMDEETKLKVFDPFYSTKGFELGRGLGMSGVYSIVKKYSGDIVVTSSELNKGTTIEIIFPISHEDESKVLSKNEPTGKESLSVLWVDDDFIISKSSRLLVESIGHKCNTLGNGKSALEYLNSNPCDIVFTDIGMPEMNGWQLAEAIRKKFGDKIKIVAVTGWDIEEKVKEEHSIDFVLQKPFDLEELKKIFMVCISIM